MQRHLERHLVERHLDDEGTTLVSETSRSESLSVSISSHSSHSSDDEEMDGIDDAASRTPSKQYLIQIDSVDSHARTAMEIMYRKANAMDGHDSVHTDGDSMGLGSAMNGVEVAAERVAEEQAQLYDLRKVNRAYYDSSEND